VRANVREDDSPIGEKPIRARPFPETGRAFVEGRRIMAPDGPKAAAFGPRSATGYETAALNKGSMAPAPV